jgi:hypothetical protein
VAGVVDAWIALEELTRLVMERKPSSGPSDVDLTFAEITACARGRMSYLQIYAIVEKYIAQNPAHWHYHMPTLIWSAMSESCLQPKSK